MIDAVFRSCKKSITVLALEFASYCNPQKTVVLSSYNLIKQAKCRWKEATKTSV